MDRYRGPRDRLDRERDDHPNVEYFGAGESYRPGGSTGEGPYRPPGRDRALADTWSSDRRDTRRDERRDDIDSYIPSTSARAQRPRSRSPAGDAYRRRSGSPPPRERGDLFPNRARSPPRRSTPTRDERPRSPPRRRSRSPYGRPRSPQDAKRPRDYSPDNRRSPKRERLASPDRGRFDRTRSPPRRSFSPPRDGPRGGSFRPRSRTPPRRDERRSAYADDNWRRRSPSPRPSGSNNTSRRSSPPVHPDRASLAGSGPRSPARPPRYESRDSGNYRPRSPSRRHDLSPPREFSDRGRNSPAREENRSNAESIQPPSGPSGYRNGTYDRPPPSGPSRGYTQAPQAPPPTGPASSTVSMSAHNRGTGPAIPSAPTRPRGGAPGRFDGPTRDFTSPPGRGRGNLTYRAPGLPAAPRAASYHDGPPSGPRGGGFGRGDFGAPRGDYGSSRGGFGRGSGLGDNTAFPFRQNSSSSATYPRTQRFNSGTSVSTVQQQLSSLEKIIPGGKLLPSGMPPEQERKLKTLEAEAEKMRAEIAEKQKTKREALTEWEVRERESERDGLKSDLAEAALLKLSTDGDEGMGSAAAF